MLAIKDHLLDAERYDTGGVIDLSFEHSSFRKKHLYKTDTSKIFKKCAILCSSSSQKPLDQLSYRELHRLRKASKEIRKDKYGTGQTSHSLLKAIPLGILIELAAQHAATPMFVTNENLDKASELLRLNLELQGFLRIEPLIAEKKPAESESLATFNQVFRLHRIFLKRNFRIPAQSPLHMLASLGKLNNVESGLLERLLAADSIQAKGLLMRSAEGRTPLCEAILYGNLDFVRQVLKSEAAHLTPWLQLLNLEQLQMQKAILRQFSPCSLSAFDKKTYDQSDRYSFQVSFVCAIEEHLKARVQRGLATYEELTAQTNAVVDTFWRSLRLSGRAKQTKEWINSAQKLKVASQRSWWGHFFFHDQSNSSQKWQSHSLFAFPKEEHLKCYTLNKATQHKENFCATAPDEANLQAVVSTEHKAAKGVTSAMFLHPSLLQGQLVMQLCLLISADTLSDLFTRVSGLEDLFFSGSCPLSLSFPLLQRHRAKTDTLFPYQDRSSEVVIETRRSLNYEEKCDTEIVLSRLQEKGNLAAINSGEFSLNKFPSAYSNHCYTLKLALLSRPNDSDLHDWILTQMDFDLMRPLQFEILCLLAHYKGCQHPKFLELFQKRAWLMGQAQPLPTAFKHATQVGSEFENYYCGANNQIRFDQVGSVYGDAQWAYSVLVVSLGTSLIRQHETEFFTDFFVSLRSFYMSDAIVTQFVVECLNHFAVECLVPILTLCRTDRAINAEALKRAGPPAKRGSDQVRVSRSQVQTALALREDFAVRKDSDGQSSNLTIFLKNAPTHLVDKCVHLLIQFQLTAWHAHSYLNLRMSSCLNNKVSDEKLLSETMLIRAVLDFASVDMSARFAASLSHRAKALTKHSGAKSAQKIVFFQLLFFFAKKWQRSERKFCSFELRPTKYVTHHNRQAKQMLEKVLTQAVTDPDQLAFIKASLSDEALADEAAGWLGVERSVYLGVCGRALSVVERRKSFVDERFFKWEVASAAGHAICAEQLETDEPAPIKMIKLRASRGNKKPKENAFEGLLAHQKLQRLVSTIENLLDCLSLEEHTLFFLIFFQNSYYFASDEVHSHWRHLEDPKIQGLLRLLKSADLQQQVNPQYFARMGPLFTLVFDKVIQGFSQLQVGVQYSVTACVNQLLLPDRGFRGKQEAQLCKNHVKALNAGRRLISSRITADTTTLSQWLSFFKPLGPDQEDISVGADEYWEREAEENNLSYLLNLESAKATLAHQNELLSGELQVVPAYLYFVAGVNEWLLGHEAPLKVFKKLGLFVLRTADDDTLRRLFRKHDFSVCFSEARNNQQAELLRILNDRERGTIAKALAAHSFFKHCQMLKSEQYCKTPLNQIVKQRVFGKKLGEGSSIMHVACAQDTQEFWDTVDKVIEALQKIIDGEGVTLDESNLELYPGLGRFDISAMEHELRQPGVLLADSDSDASGAKEAELDDYQGTNQEEIKQPALHDDRNSSRASSDSDGSASSDSKRVKKKNKRQDQKEKAEVKQEETPTYCEKRRDESVAVAEPAANMSVVSLKQVDYGTAPSLEADPTDNKKSVCCSIF